jgi:class 3 adenylate cyclase/tetratricopeptide (TPR) repeat protein
MTSTATVTILFTDVVGSVELRTSRGDESAHRILEAHSELVRQQIEEHSGQEVKTIGDSFMVSFESAQKGVDCAVAVQQALKEHNTAHPEEKVEVRIGLNTGKAIRQKGDLFGTTVDAASRVMSKAAGGQIFVPEAVRSAISEIKDISIVDRGLFWLKGFPDRWRLYEVLWGEQQASPPVVHRAVAEQTSFVGREKERAELRRLLDRASGGRGTLVMMAGEPGVGKTRITEELTTEAYRHGLLTLVGHCYEMEGAPPYIPFVENIESAARIVKAETLRNALGDAAPEAAKLLPQLRQRFPEIPQPQQLPPEQERRFLLNSLRDFFERLALDRAILMVIEDLHWADDSTLLLIDHIAQRIHEMPVLIVATYRHTELDIAPSLAKTLEELNRRRLIQELTLKLLSRTDVSNMLQSKIEEQAPERLTELIYQETEGNPFFVEEILKHLSEEGKVFDDEGRLRSEIKISEHEVPKGIRSVIGRRLDRVSEECRHVLSAAAIIGRAFDFELLEELVDLDEDAVFNAIDSAERTQLIVAEPKNGNINFKFYHELIRQTLITDLSSMRRQRIHLRVGEAMENLYADSIEEHIPAVAHHFFQAGNAADPGKTLHYLTLAGDRALTASAFEDALRLFDNVLTLIPKHDKQTRADLLHKRGLVLRSIGRREEAIADWREALDIHEESGNIEAIGQICEVLSFTYFEDFRLAEASEAVERGLAALGARVTSSRCHLLATAALMAGYMPGNYQQAHNLFDQAIAVANELEDEQVLGPILHRKAQYFYNVHWKAMETVDAGKRGSELLCAARNLYEAADSLEAARYGLIVLGRMDEAIQMRVEVESLSARSGNDTARWMTHGNSAICELITGADFARCEDLMSSHLEYAQSALPIFLPLNYTNLAMPQFWSGKWEKAQKNLRAGVDSEFPSPIYGYALGPLFSCLAYAGDKETALRMLPQMKDMMPQPGQPDGVGAWVVLESAVEGLAVLEEWDEAAKLYPLALEAVATGNLIYWLFNNLVQTIAGIAAMAGRQWEKAAEHYEIALRQAHETPFRVAQPEVRRWHARMLIERNSSGDKEKARTLLNEANAMYSEIGMPKHLEMAEKLMQRL